VVPLRELTRVAGELGAGRLASRVRLPHYGTSEVLELGERFNHMAARIEQQVTQQTELLHAVSHELRTPLTRLRVLLGILADSGTHPKLTADLEREVLELDQLVGELLANARIDAGALKARALPIAEALRDGLSRAGLDALRVRAKAVPSTVWADPTLFARALGVLLDNAQKHGGGARGVEVSMRDGLLWFAVQDGGAGVPEADLPRIFEPFARGGGRAPDEAQGLGLGLYLVRRIAEAHGGSVAAHNLPAGGASIGFGLPATPRAA